ncbi:MAG: hypothetical protein SFX72_03825 [Isosphaeraceae bacterium]|nr:hypothetical protein [Isosphaeraceae bacterium]
MRRLRWIVSLSLIAGFSAGCGSTRPRNFRAMLHPEPIVRARAAGLNGSEPDHIAVPTLIERLDDRDPVVRLTAHEALKERTGKDFGYIPWADEAERAESAAKWRTWWEGSRVGAYKLRPDALGKTRRKP